MKNYLAYTRVSTVKQGERGVSLPEQKAAIEQYARQNHLPIDDWFEEQETAAKKGRPIFAKMMRLLTAGKASGVIIHKIDRSARNLKDWADLQELSEQGIEVHFANESIILNTRGNRLLADIQAVVAADYIRNLREETRKGIIGRLKQGLYPMPAPIGYLNVAPGKPKVIDPDKAPFIKKAFESYSMGNCNLQALAAMLYAEGFRERNGGKVNRSSLSVILNNPFYAGIIRIKKTGDIFPGVHEPIVKKSLFDEVQAVLSGKRNGKTRKHDFLFRRMISCKLHGRCLVAEKHRGSITYYRCHATRCPTRIPERIILAAVTEKLRGLQFSQEEKESLNLAIKRLKTDWIKRHQEYVAALEISIGKVVDRLGRLTDAYLDQALEKADFEQRKTALVIERRELQRKLEEVRGLSGSALQEIEKFISVAGTAYSLYESSDLERKRNLMKIVSSNFVGEAKSVDFMLCSPFREIALREKMAYGCPPSGIGLNFCEKIIDFLKDFCETTQANILDRYKLIMPENDKQNIGNFSLSSE